MRAITAQEQTYLRTWPQKTRLKIYIRKPTSIYTAQLDGVPSSTDMVLQISFKNGSGTLGDVKVNMIMYVGSSVGAYDLGMIRIRKTPIAGTFYVGEVGDVAWVDSCYLTVVDDPYGAWARHLKISGVTPYMDGDIPYSDQLTNYDPIVIMGTDRVVKLTGSTVDVAFDASDSWAFDDTIASYSWSAPGASATSGMATATPTITYNAQGQYRVYCTVTTTTGSKSYTAARTVFVDAGTLGVACTVKNIRGSDSEGGWTFDVEMIDNVAIEDVLPNVQVILVAEDYYGSTQVSIGPIVGSENIVVIGWIVTEKLNVSIEQSKATFKVAGLQYLLKHIPAFVVGIENHDSASSAWTNALNLTVQKGLFFAIHWRSTIPHITDIFLESVTWETIEVTGPEGSLFAQLQAIVNAQWLGRPLCNRYSQLFLERDPQLVPEASRTWDTVRTLATQDYTGNIEITVAQLTPTARVYLDGVWVSSRSSFGPLFSLAPAHTPKRFGIFKAVTNLLLNSQSQANVLAGLQLTWDNNKYPEVDIPLTSNDRFEDIAPQQFIAGTFTDTVRNVTVSGNFIPRTIEYHWSEKDGQLITELLTELENEEGLAINGDVPEVGDISTVDYPSYHLPTFKLPEIPTVIPFEEESVTGPNRVVIVTSDKGVLYSGNFNEASPSWAFINLGLTSDQYTNIVRILKTPSGAMFALIQDPVRGGSGADWVFWTPAPGSAWTELFSISDLVVASPNLVAIGFNPNLAEEIAIFTGSSSSNAGQLFTGDRNGVTELAGGIDSTGRLGDISFINNKWFITHCEQNAFSSQAWSLVQAGGTIDYNTRNPILGQTYAAAHQRHKSGGEYLFWWNTDSRYLRTVVNNDGDASDTTMPNLGSITATPPNLLTVSPTGQYLMGGKSSVIGQRSTDYGVTWGNVSATLGIGYHIWENCRSDNRFLTATTQSIKYTDDFGDSWTDKSGNLPTIASLCTITHILYLSD